MPEDPEQERSAIDRTEAFYDWLAAEYDAVYADWEGSVRRQAVALNTLIRAELESESTRVLDCTCGVGTQALGLASLGLSVVGTDISKESIQRARIEADARGLHVEFHVADVRSLSVSQAGPFDVVLSADNALPHLTSDDDLRLALQRMLHHVRPGGLLVASIRDYDATLRERPAATSPTHSIADGVRRVTFQLWHWDRDGRSYDLEMFLLREMAPGEWKVDSRRAGYRAITRADLSTILEDLGLESVRWHLPATSGFFQPIVTARRPS